MRIEITIDKAKKLPNGAEPALEAEFLRRKIKNMMTANYLFVARVLMDSVFSVA